MKIKLELADPADCYEIMHALAERIAMLEQRVERWKSYSGNEGPTMVAESEFRLGRARNLYNQLLGKMV